MNKKLPKKFTDRELDEFIDSIYKNFVSTPTDNYFFDLTEVEFIGNQELLVLSALFKSFYESDIKFTVLFYKDGTPTGEINERVKRQIIQFWDVWKIWQIVPQPLYKEYFGIDGNFVQRLQEELNYYPKLSELYNRHGITPFVHLDYINNYNEIDVQDLINPIYKLNSVIEDLLSKNRCHHPFTSNSLSTIITEELYLNFLDHSTESSFNEFQQMAFMSISFQSKLDETKISKEEIQIRRRLNFQTECLDETIDFFFDKKAKKYKNNSYIQFSFLDFGQGIVNTLKPQFPNKSKSDNHKNVESDILKYAFNHNSSRHPIFHEKNKLEQFIPRGLFDALTIVRRYKGLLIVRSNFGKILFDFSNESDINKAFSYFGNNKFFFPGTLISLYLPAIEDTSKLNVSSIKPEINFVTVKPDNKKYVSVNSIVENLNVPKEELYSKLLKELKDIICDKQEHSLVFVSFKGCEIPKRIIKKTIYFLLTDYDINHRNNVVILNSPPENIIEEIASEILLLNDALKNYKLHPLPIIDFDPNNEDLNIRWLGIYDDSDKEKLNNLLYEEYSIAKSDFKDPANVSGHLNEFDSYGNLISNFPNRADIINFYRLENDILTSNQVDKLLAKHDCIKKDDNDSLYLCNGNYYQKEYVELNNLVNDKSDCNTVTQLLHSKLKFQIKNLKDFKFIGITTTSHKLLKSLELQNLISKNDYISLDNYHTFENDLNEEVVDSTKKYILICDVISTGFLTQRLNTRLAQLGTNIEYIAVVTSILHPNFKTTKSFLKDYEGKIFFLHEYPIVKLMRNELGKEMFSKKIIRINPHTNIPIRLSINETNFNESIIFHTSINYSEPKNEITIQNKFLDSVSENAIHVGFYKFNNVIHPYFFNTEKILKEFSEDLLKEVFRKISNPAFAKEKIQVFYPRKSGIDFFNFTQLKSVLKNQLIEEIEIERFGTPEGWRFPHNTDYLSAKIENNFCFILDDGSCSGDSLIQMIDEISFYDAKEIVLLCIIGRVNDHKREFFSRLSNIKVKNGKSIPISIYFVCHWHIPTYYLDENPNIKETVWLNDIINLQNTPQSIKKIANSIVEQIKPKSDTVFKDYKYLPREKDTNEIPKKELLIVREELGKVIGYRLYKESFNFFDSFIKKYQKKSTAKDHFKEIELLCATFIYEPYLYDKIVGVLPDVTERIESFVENLVFSKEKIYDNLTFKWNKKDIVHLFFIVFKNEKLIAELTIERFKQLIEFTQQVDSTTNYILYKLLKYFPLNTFQFAEKKFDNQIKDLIIKLKDDETIPNKEVKKYYNFITSLPSRSDFNSQLSQLKANYAKQKEQEFHDEKKSFNHNVSELIVTIREIVSDIKNNKSLQTSNINTIRKCWFKILNFINPILSFSSSFTEFLSPYTFYELVNQATSLREMVGFIEEMILSSNESVIDLEKMETIKKYVTKIQLDFELNSTFHQVIENHQSNLVDLVSTLKKEISSSFKISESEEMPAFTKSTLNIPKVYMDKLLVAELTTNMKKYSKNGSTQINLTYKLLSQDQFELQITNEVLNLNSKNSNGEGTKCLRLLSDSGIFGFKYSSSTVGKEYIQTLTFNLN
jgi:uncharacterized protein YukE